jgi:hypothetical protein
VRIIGMDSKSQVSANVFMRIHVSSVLGQARAELLRSSRHEHLEALNVAFAEKGLLDGFKGAGKRSDYLNCERRKTESASLRKPSFKVTTITLVWIPPCLGKPQSVQLPQRTTA